VRDLLLISDLHLGSHMKSRSRGEYVHLAARIEESLPRFLEHYSRLGTWQLIINGDFIDFWNIEIGDQEGDAEDVAVHRLNAVLDAYPGVEEGMIRFLEEGNGIVIVAGNHDTEFLYPRVREAMAMRLETGMDQVDASVTETGVTRLSDLEGGKVRFVPWFLREEGGAWIEHGHLFDAACSTGALLSPTRGGRLVKTVAEVATRRFSNMMPEIDYDSADKFTTLDYVRWAAARGHRFMIRVLLLYLKMVGHMAFLWARGGVDRAGRKLHQERLARVAANAGLQMSALTALQKMAPPPSSATVWGVLSVTAMDLLLSAILPLVLVPVLFALLGGSPGVGLLIGASLAALIIYRIRERRTVRNVAQDMLRVAAHVGEVTGVPLVLMGHSHYGSLERRGSIIYGNSGSWLDGSHLVVKRDRMTARLDRVELRQWRNGGVCGVGALAVGEPDGALSGERELPLHAAMGGSPES
jgi:UDP-2,3-diacylglucosamine pyrophosphatase LpxH